MQRTHTHTHTKPLTHTHKPTHTSKDTSMHKMKPKTGPVECTWSSRWISNLTYIGFHSLALGSECRNHGESGYRSTNPAKLQWVQATAHSLPLFSQFQCICYSSGNQCLFISEWGIHHAPMPIMRHEQQQQRALSCVRSGCVSEFLLESFMSQQWRPAPELFLVKAGKGTSGGLDSLCTSIKGLFSIFIIVHRSFDTPVIAFSSLCEFSHLVFPTPLHCTTSSLFSSSSRIQSHTDWFIYDEWLSSQWLHWK